MDISPKLISGSQPIDDGQYIFKTEQQRDEFLSAEPRAKAYLHPYMSGKDYLENRCRWILALHDAPPNALAGMPHVRDRIARVREFRSRSKRKQTLMLADYPTRYNVNVIPAVPFLVIPEVSSELREYVPIGWLEPPVIPSNKLRILADATLSQFAVLTSAMHMAWLRHIGGRLKSDYSYGIGLVYNTFPTPPADANTSKLEPLAQAVLDARATYPNATLADLYYPDLMPPNLRRAHQALDRAVDRLYRRSAFASERERVEHLFRLYEQMQTPLGIGIKKPIRRRQ